MDPCMDAKNYKEWFAPYYCATILICLGSLWYVGGKVFQAVSLSTNVYVKELIFFRLQNNEVLSLWIFFTVVCASYIIILKIYGFVVKICMTPFRFRSIIHGCVQTIIVYICAFVVYNYSKFPYYLFNGDVFFLGVAVGGMLFLLFKNKYKNKESDEGICQLLLDPNPIGSSDCDLFGFDSISKQLVGMVESGDVSHRVIALYGKNGAGKSSILKMFSNSIARNKESCCEVCYFYPYLYNSDIEMTRALVDKIVSALNSKYIFPCTMTLTLDFMKSFFGAMSMGGFFGSLFYGIKSLFVREKKVHEIIKMIDYFLKYKKEKIVLIVDDLDRCSVKKRYLFFNIISALNRVEGLYCIVAASPNELLDYSKPKLMSVVD